MQVLEGIAICAYHGTLIYNDTPGNAASRFICNANLPPDHAHAQHGSTVGYRGGLIVQRWPVAT